MTSFFTAFYAGMTIIAGWVIDKIGTKIGLALSLIVWSMFGIANAFVGRLVTMHILVRSAFAVGEGGNFPASIKTVAEWFPKRERALATGIFNSGSNFGAMVAALFVPWCMIHFGDERGWKMAFIITGAAGFLWLIFWFWLYEIPARQKRLSKAEFDYIHSDKDDAGVEEKPAKGVIEKLFSFAGRVPRAAFWGTMILVGILTSVYLSDDKPDCCQRVAYLCSWRRSRQRLKVLLSFPMLASILDVPAWPGCIVVAWVAARAANKTLARPGKNRLAGPAELRAGGRTLISLLVLGFSKGMSGPNKYGGRSQPRLAGIPADVVVFLGQISHRRHLVVLSFLAAGLFEQTIRHDQAADHDADVHRLWRRHHRQRLWRQHSHDAHQTAACRFTKPACWRCSSSRLPRWPF